MSSFKTPKEQWFQSKRTNEFSKRTKEFNTTSYNYDTNEWFVPIHPRGMGTTLSVTFINEPSEERKKERKVACKKERKKERIK